LYVQQAPSNPLKFTLSPYYESVGVEWNLKICIMRGGSKTWNCQLDRFPWEETGEAGENWASDENRLGAWDQKRAHCACTYHKNLVCYYAMLAVHKENECCQSISVCDNNDTRELILFFLCRLKINTWWDAKCGFILELGVIVNS
jgi:hypothetical protein